MPQNSEGSVTYNVLLTGLGTSPQFPDINPSWAAVRPLHNTFIPLEPPQEPPESDKEQQSPDGRQGEPILNQEPKRPPPQEIRISCLQIPVEYEAIQQIVPGLHARPPMLPEHVKNDINFPQPPDRGYDLIFHIGTAGRGPLRMEKCAHKTGYHMKDALGKYAPICQTGKKVADEQNGAAAAVGLIPEPHPPAHNQLVPSPIPHTDHPPVEAPPARINRGFNGGAYDRLEEELQSDIDVVRLVGDMKQGGIEGVYSSMDAGHYICDFIYFCSLAEAKRHGKPYDKDLRRVLLLHCPPPGLPVPTATVTDAVKQIVYWVCEDTYFPQQQKQ
ncbi:peptidase C15, pyroglutamyl peptidase I-like protein [Cylindrobasidium torrendii FP15055 ss-10]|uniref:Peptidase C15, pyroglutamyl peptidase I-like protein n=1 Tax=Cylindrobasidium torrendii FP15055 ss-10 TaxID=1314674 RepID=A0A0D7BVU6_9AGAR|nr:peptidase C15, pyroglutamyl peptidase I-like protein [Cylindrobasidium torrendii FP15055 ss-10]